MKDVYFLFVFVSAHVAVCFSISDLYNSGPSSVHTETHITRSKMAFSNLFSRLSAVDEGVKSAGQPAVTQRYLMNVYRG